MLRDHPADARVGSQPLKRLAELGSSDAYTPAVSVLERTLRTRTIEVTGQEVPIAIDAQEVKHCYAPSAVLLQRLSRCAGRALVAIAGPPGSGKSVLATLLTRAVSALDDAAPEGSGRASAAKVRPVWLGLDGFHYPNDLLLSRTVVVDGESARLKRYKGAEFTFDAAAAKAKFREIKHGCGAAVTAPAYDRGLHEPVADAVAVAPDCRLVIVEGNYLLLNEGDWQGMADLFDLSIYIDMSLAECKLGLIARHCRGGRDPDDAEQHYQRVDVRNHRVIEATRHRADLIVQKAADHRVVDVLVQEPDRIGRLMAPTA